MHDLKNLKCLLPKTQALLKEMVRGCPFLEKYVFVGGSALALYLCHRKSEDLDFFTFDDSFDKKEIFEYFKEFDNKEVLSESDVQIDVLLDGVKVTFFNVKWKFLQLETIEKFNLASIESISAMKVNAMFLRAKYRDYYDLYCLVKNGMSLKDIFEYSKNIVEGINFKLFAIALIYIDDIEDDNIAYLEPKEKISKEEIRDFFQSKLKAIL